MLSAHLKMNMAPKCLIQACFRQYETDRLEYEIESDEFNSSVDTDWKRWESPCRCLSSPQRGHKINCRHDTELLASWSAVEYDNVTTIFQIGKFMALVIIGHRIHSTIVLPLTYFLCTRCNPYDVIKEVVPALKQALVSSSSVNTLPLTAQCCESRLVIHKSVTRYMLPIGTNMDGTALYEVAAAIFITQINHLKIGQLIAITDRCNSVVNVLGNCIGVAIVHEVSKGQLGEMDQGPSTPRSSMMRSSAWIRSWLSSAQRSTARTRKTCSALWNIRRAKMTTTLEKVHKNPIKLLS
nr:excitatory amino acid transporter 3-like isoform X3 [Pseudochaenichthys georgianus]